MVWYSVWTDIQCVSYLSCLLLSLFAIEPDISLHLYVTCAFTVVSEYFVSVYVLYFGNQYSSVFISIIVNCGVVVWPLCTGANRTFWILENFSGPLWMSIAGNWWACPWSDVASYVLIVRDIWTGTVECRRSSWLYETFNTVFDYLYELVSHVSGTLHLCYRCVYICL